MNMKTLSELLSMKVQSEDKDGNPVAVSPDFRIAVQEEVPGAGVRVIVHPQGHNGDTLDLWIKGNTVTHVVPRPANPPVLDPKKFGRQWG